MEPGLIPYFQYLPGMYKADLCGAVDLNSHGGYYFDVDILFRSLYGEILRRAIFDFSNLSTPWKTHKGKVPLFFLSAKPN
jgi:hypothetical protein